MSRENEMSEEADEGELGMHRMAEQGWVRVEASDRVSLVIHPAAPQPEPVAEVIDREHQPWEHGKHTSWLVNPSDLPAGTKLYAAAPPAAPAPAVPLTREQQIAIREAHCNTASDEYFGARPQVGDVPRRRIYEAGFKEGWEIAHGIGGGGK